MRPAAILLPLLLAGCAMSQLKPYQGGKSSASIGGDVVEVTTPENPQTPTTQTTKKTTVRKYAKAPASGRNGYAEVKEEVSPIQPSLEEETVTQEMTVQIGAAHKDDSREMAAKLAAMGKFQWVGVALLVAALAMFHPAARILTGFSREMQMITGAAGAVLIFGPQLIAGNELYIIIGLVGVYILKRLSYKSGIIDANGNGIPDIDETKKP